MTLAAALRCWAAEVLAVGQLAYAEVHDRARAYTSRLPFSGEQLLKVGTKALALALFWPLAWTWAAHYAASRILLLFGWTPSLPATHPKAVQLEEAVARAAALALERDSARAAERNQSCKLRLLQDQCNDKATHMTKLAQALAAKEVEVKAYRQALGRESVENTPPARGMSPDQQDGCFPEPNTPEERIQRVSWPNASPTAHASTSSPASARASKSNSRKLEHNWDWHDLLGDMGAAAATPDTADKLMVTPAFQPPALEAEQSYSEAAPREYLDPISLTLIKDPVVTPAGVTYDRTSIAAYIEANHSDPATGAPLQPTMLYPNLALRDLIQKFLVDAPPLSTATSLSSPSLF